VCDPRPEDATAWRAAVTTSCQRSGWWSHGRQGTTPETPPSCTHSSSNSRLLSAPSESQSSCKPTDHKTVDWRLHVGFYTQPQVNGFHTILRHSVICYTFTYSYYSCALRTCCSTVTDLITRVTQRVKFHTRRSSESSKLSRTADKWIHAAM